MSTKTKKDKEFLKLARLKSQETDDPKVVIKPSSAVGSVLVQSGVVVAGEANRIPSALRDVIKIEEADSPDRYNVIEHSERNTLYAAWRNGISPVGGTLYCTRFPCTDCARAIILSGVSRLVVPAGNVEDERWRSSQARALEMLRAAGVIVRFLKV